MHAFLFTDLESSRRLWEEHPEETKRSFPSTSYSIQGGESEADMVTTRQILG